MIQYSIWFRIQSEVDESEALTTVCDFLEDLCAEGAVAEFQILKNIGNPAKTQRLPFRALINFCDETQFSSAFSAQTAKGIHTGLHGKVMAFVSDFQIEIFRRLTGSQSTEHLNDTFSYACEI